MNYDDDQLSEACMKSQLFHNKYQSIIHNKKQGTNHSFNGGSRKSKFAEYLDKMNTPIDKKDLKKTKLYTTIKPVKPITKDGNFFNRTNRRIATAASPYRENPEKAEKLRPVTVRNQIWKSAGPRKLFHRTKQPKNMIEQNIKNVRRLNNMNLLRKIDTAAPEYHRLNVNEKAKLLKNGVEHGEDFIIFKRRNTKRKRFNEPTPATRGHKRALSCVGVQKPKIENPNQSNLRSRKLDNDKASVTPSNLRSLSICSRPGENSEW